MNKYEHELIFYLRTQNIVFSGFYLPIENFENGIAFNVE